MEQVQGEWVETVLKKYHFDHSVARVTHVSTGSVVSKGNNYLSDMTRLNMKLITRSGRKKSKSLISKCLPSNDSRAKVVKDWGVFDKEIKMYAEVLPCMEEILEECGDKSEPLWAKCYDFRRYDRIVLEDLKELGYVMADKMKGMDLNHSQIALRGLAKFHAISAILEQQGKIKKEEFWLNPVFEKDIYNIQAYHNQVWEILAEVIETEWEPEWKEVGSKLRGLIDNSERVLLEGMKKEDNSKTFYVLNHGDFWLNNVLFKYIEGTDIPSNIRFVDLQVPNFNVPALDLQYLINTSFSTDTKMNHMEQLLSTYHETLVKWLNKLGYNSEIPSLEDFKTSMEEKSHYGIVMGLTVLPFMIGDPRYAFDVEDVVEKKENDGKKTSKMDRRIFLGEIFTERVKYIIKAGLEKGIL